MNTKKNTADESVDEQRREFQCFYLSSTLFLCLFQIVFLLLLAQLGAHEEEEGSSGL